MTMKTIVDVPTELQHSETRFTLNFQKVLSRINDFGKDEYVRTQYAFCGRTLSVLFYPRGDNKTNIVNSTAIYVSLSKAANPETTVPLKMQVKIECGSDGSSRWQILQTIGEFDKWGRGWGYDNFESLDYLKSNPTLTITAIMHYTDTSFRFVPKEHEFLTQCQAMHTWSELEGDITLQVIKRNNSYDDEPALAAPPTKKRKVASGPRRSKRLGNKNSSQAASLSDEEGEESKSASSQSPQVNEVRVSSIVLKAASPVFKRMLESNMKESQDKKITVYADSVDAVRTMIHFLWTNELPLNASQCAHLLNVIKLAHYYELERLKLACITQLIRHLSVDHFVDIVNILSQFSIEDGMKAIIEFAEKNRAEIMKNPRLSELPFLFKTGVLKIFK